MKLVLNAKANTKMGEDKPQEKAKATKYAPQLRPADWRKLGQYRE